MTIARDAPAVAAGQAARAYLAGAGCILLSSVLFTGMAALAKVLGERLPAIEVAFGRTAFGLLMTLPFVWRAGPSAWRTSRPLLHLTRGTIGTAGLVCGFYSVVHLPLAEATALSFTKPLFQVVLAALVLRETVRQERWVATGVGFLGVLVMIWPGGTGMAAGLLAGGAGGATLVALAGALCAAIVAITLRHMTQLEREVTILLYLGVAGCLVTGVPSLFVWVTPTLFELATAAAMAGIGLVSQLFLMRGFKLGEASAMAPFDYARLPLAALWGFVLFAELPAVPAIAGASVIALCTLWILRREARR